MGNKNLKCHECGSEHIIEGKIFANQFGTHSKVGGAFVPLQKKKFPITLTTPNIALDRETYLCMDCGFVWTFTSTTRAREVMEIWINEKK